jgi:hypothetical protein
MSFQWFYTDVRDVISASFLIFPPHHVDVAAKRRRALLSLERQATERASERGWAESTVLLRSWTVVSREGEDTEYHTRMGYVFESVVFDECVLIPDAIPVEVVRPVMSVNGALSVGFIREKTFYLVNALEMSL